MYTSLLLPGNTLVVVLASAGEAATAGLMYACTVSSYK